MRWTLWLVMMAAAATSHAANPSFSDALRAARAGDARSQYIVGMMYLFGDGTKASAGDGARWIESSARGGLPQAQVALATLLDIGHGVPLDVDRATQLRTQAAQAGNPTARAQLDADRRIPGTHDFRRADALDDFKRYGDAFPYARRSAEAGHPDGMDLLGRAYLLGRGTPKNEALAVEWFRKADAAGSMGGARSMGHVYEFGRGVPVDRKQALKYYDRAAARGSDIAKQAAANLRSPDYDPPALPPSGGSGVTYCNYPYVWDFGMGYCRAPSQSDPPNMQHDSGPH